MDERILIGASAFVVLVIAFFIGCVWDAIFYIGLIRLLMFYSSAAHFVNKYFIRGRLNLVERYGKGSYALVTGGANGIGFEYSKQLAAAGFNLIILDLDEAGLERAKKAISEEHKACDIETVPCNLLKLTEQAHYEEFVERFNDKDIAILVNNAGVADYNPFHEIRPEAVSMMMQVNDVAVIALSKIFFNKFLKREKRGGIINMASGVGLASNKLVSIYPSTKAFVKYFTEILNEEARGKVDMLYIYPGAVTTDATAKRVAPDSCMPDVIARNALNSLGQDGYNSGYWLHDIGSSFVESLFYTNHEFYRLVEDLVIEKTGLGNDLRNIAKGQVKEKKE